MKRVLSIGLIALLVGAVAFCALGAGNLDGKWRAMVMNGYGTRGMTITVLTLAWRDGFYEAGFSVYTLTTTVVYEAQGVAYATGDALVCLFPQEEATRVDTFLYESETDTLAWQWSVVIADGEYEPKDVQLQGPYERLAAAEDGDS